MRVRNGILNSFILKSLHVTNFHAKKYSNDSHEKLQTLKKSAIISVINSCLYLRLLFFFWSGVYFTTFNCEYITSAVSVYFSSSLCMSFVNSRFKYIPHSIQRKAYVLEKRSHFLALNTFSSLIWNIFSSTECFEDLCKLKRRTIHQKVLKIAF